MSSAQLIPDDVFTCRRCGDCCRGYGGTFVSRADMEAIAAFIHADPRTFAERYCRLSGGKPVLAQRADGYCVFWDRVCTIHAVKPRMCRRWPFIESILVDPANWLAMAGSCPGMRTGIPLGAVRACVAAVLASEGPERGADDATPLPGRKPAVAADMLEVIGADSRGAPGGASGRARIGSANRCR